MNTHPIFASLELFAAGLPFLVFLALLLVVLIGMWKVFVKAGQPGWGSIIPIFNAYCLVKIAGKPGWWLLLFFIPLVNLIITILVCIGISRNFGKGDGFAFGLVFLPFIFYPILGFGDASYGGAAPSSAA
jgi:hypothetical protein